MLGHNNPPSEKKILEERLERYTEIPAQLEKLKCREIPEKIKDDKQAGDITLYIKSLKSVVSDAEKIRKKEKDIYLECGRVVDAWKKKYENEATTLINKASAPLLDFQAEKDRLERERQLEIARKAREEAEALAAEAEAHANEGIDDTANDLLNAAIESETKSSMIEASSMNVRSHTRHSSGAVSSTSKVWTGEIESLGALDLEKLRPYLSQTELDRAVKAYAKKTDGAELRGARIYQQSKLNIR